MLITRVAPTPSGYLHAGNAVNFLLVAWLAASAESATVQLRIDDMNMPVVRTEHLDDIFWALDWLGIPITEGPSDVASFRGHHSQFEHRERYRAELGPLRQAGFVYACACSRREVAERPPGHPDPCRSRDLALEPGRTALRFHARELADTTDHPLHAGIGDSGLGPQDIAAEMGDFVVWRRDDLPAYQLASVAADRDAGTNTVVRGEDLRASTAAQLLLAEPLGAGTFATARFIHHPLLTDATGGKLSKSAGADSLRSIAATPGGRQRLWVAATRLAAEVGIAAPEGGPA